MDSQDKNMDLGTSSKKAAQLLFLYFPPPSHPHFSLLFLRHASNSDNGIKYPRAGIEEHGQPDVHSVPIADKQRGPWENDRPI